MSAGFSTETLKAQISQSGGMAQPHQFVVTLPQLKTFKVDARELSILCSATVLPGRQITSSDYTLGTKVRKIANGYAITDMNLNFIVMNDHKVRQYFEAWQQEAHDQVNGEVGYYDDYTYPVTVEHTAKGARLALFKKQLGFADKIPSFIKNRLPKLGPIDLAQGEIDLGASFQQKTTYVCRLLDCYPTTITDQSLGNAQEGLMEISVQLSFSDWESKKGNHTGKSESLGRGILASGLAKLLGKFS